MDYNECDALLSSALDHPISRIKFESWNDAVAAQAELRAHIKSIDKMLAELPGTIMGHKTENPYKNIRMKVVRPSILVFTIGAPPQVEPVPGEDGTE